MLALELLRFQKLLCFLRQLTLGQHNHDRRRWFEDAIDSNLTGEISQKEHLLTYLSFVLGKGINALCRFTYFLATSVPAMA